ncbi:MAG TPA: hypothetical protein VFX02_10800 [Gammaproteobacteria bacterium]|nr:hypothetical protein [Gammaproteobacteria bacterium]
MRKLISSIILLVAFLSVLGLIVLIAYPFIAFNSKGTDVAFQSSDGNWADSEVLFKGRDFDSIVIYFELYKISCNAPDAQLQRVTDKPNIFSMSWWFDDFDLPKWKVPLAMEHPESLGDCDGARKEGEYELAKQRAAAYIASLSKTHNKAF